MLAFLAARAPGPAGKPDAKKVKAFAAANPETLHQANYIAAHPMPPSFAATTYWGVHAFPATNAKGETRFVKFKVVPIAAGVTRARAKAGAAAADVLRKDLEARIAAGEARFSLIALLDRPGDAVMDVTIRWRDEDRRDAIRLGTIVITGIEAEEVCAASAFDPGRLAEGIAHPPDEIFAARRAAYAIAQAKRR
jgi:catalase